MIEPYRYLLTRGISPDTPLLDLSVAGVEGSNKAKPLSTETEAEPIVRPTSILGRSGLASGNLGKEVISWENKQV